MPGEHLRSLRIDPRFRQCRGIGAAEAVRQAGVPPHKIAIVAKDIDPQGEKLLMDGYLSYLLVGEPVEMGRASARLLRDVLENKDTPRNVLLRNYLVDAASVREIVRSGFTAK